MRSHCHTGGCSGTAHCSDVCSRPHASVYFLPLTCGIILGLSSRYQWGLLNPAAALGCPMLPQYFRFFLTWLDFFRVLGASLSSPLSYLGGFLASLCSCHWEGFTVSHFPRAHLLKRFPPNRTGTLTPFPQGLHVSRMTNVNAGGDREISPRASLASLGEPACGLSVPDTALSVFST